MGGILIKKHDPWSCTNKYNGISPYDIDVEERYDIYNEDIIFVNNYGYAIIGNPNHTDRNPTDHEYFLILYYMLDIILETDQNYDIVLKVISKYVSFT